GGDTAEVEHWRLSGWLIMDAPLKWIGVHAPILLVGLLHSGEAAAVLGTVRALISFANVFLSNSRLWCHACSRPACMRAGWR
ncbi:hypothetical protein RZS08_32840, partial [Arthrospira platensis SPKY1]|nr:hypothetical protein [Arthrospira platensis SPKY1]